MLLLSVKANLLAHAAGAKVVGLKHADYDFKRKRISIKPAII